jgi:hypothetical protein
MEDFSLEIGSPRPNEPARVSGSRYLQPGEYLPMASEDGYKRETRGGRMRGIQQQPPPFDGYGVDWHEAADRGSYDRSRQSPPETTRAAASARATSSSHRSEASDDSYYRPERVSTSRSGTGAGYEYVIPAHEPTHDMGGEWVQYGPGYNSTRDFGSGRIERPGASEYFRGHPVSQPSRHSPPISTTSSTSRHEVSRNSYHLSDSSSYSVSSSDSEETVVAPVLSSSSSVGHRGREMILYGTGHPGPPSSYSEQCSHQSADVCENYQGSLGCSESTRENYYDDDDDGGGVYLEHDVWPEASYSYSGSGDDNEWSNGRSLRIDSRGRLYRR